MKAYIDLKSGDVRMFRPEMNMARLNSSCKRLYLPQFKGEEVLKCIKELVRLDKNVIPQVSRVGRVTTLYCVFMVT